jgi:hypothetical protein
MTRAFALATNKELFVMRVRTFLAAVAVSAATLVPTLSHAAAAGPPCILDEHRVVSVQPYEVDQHYGRFISPQVRGAQIYVQAEPGLTAEWLQLTLERHLTEMKGPATMPDCAFDMNDVRIEVTPAGPGFSVRLIAPDTKSGQEVLRRAQLLVS